MRTFLYFILFSFFLTGALFAQEKDAVQKTRPKIGLVLSGGGAKGMAHIGVMKVLEEVGIRPDYIAGTSMGAIMGGLYSIGYNAAELDSIIRGIDWDQMLSDRIPLSMVVPIEKHDYNRLFVTLSLSEKGPQLPDGLISGQGIAEFMNRLTWPVANVKNFDDYPIPFRCVASDIISGEPHVFKSGKLATAMRASMAIPSVFSPVRLDSMLLVDGGVLDNLPVKVCRDMGADIIISVNVGLSDRPKIEDFKNIGDVLFGTAMIRSNRDTEKAIKASDIVITPSLAGYNTASFTSGAEIIDAGEKAAREKIGELKKLAESLKKYKQKPVKPVEIKKVDKVLINKIKVDTLYTLRKKFVIGKFGLKEGGVYTSDQIDNGLHRLIGTRYIDNVDYSLSKYGDGFELTLYPKESYRSKLSLGLHYDNRYRAGVVLNASFRNLLVKSSHFKVAFDISQHPRILSEFYRYLGEGQKFGTYSKIRWENSMIPVYRRNGSNIADITHYYFNGETGLFLSPGTKTITSLGVFYRQAMFKHKADLANSDSRYIGNNWGGLRFVIYKNTLDTQYFPSTGSRMNLKIDVPMWHSSIHSSSDETSLKYASVPNGSYVRATISGKRHIPILRTLNLGLRASGGWSSATMPFADLFSIGGIETVTRANDISFYGLMPREIIAGKYAKIGTNLRYSILPGLYVHGMLNVLGAWEEQNLRGSVNNSGDNITTTTSIHDFILGGGIQLSYQSIFGRMELGYGRNSLHSTGRWYFTLGYPF